MFYKIKLTAVFLIIIMAMSLSGCSDAAEDVPLALSVVVGAHSNAGSIPLNAETVTSQLYQVARTQGTLRLFALMAHQQLYSKQRFRSFLPMA